MYAITGFYKVPVDRLGFAEDGGEEVMFNQRRQRCVTALQVEVEEGREMKA